MKAILNKIQLMVGRAIIAAVNDNTRNQQAQIDLLAGESQEAERFSEYGYTSVPLPGCEGITICVGGNRDHGIIIATNDSRYRLKGLAPGEVAIYTDEGSYIKLSRGRIIDIKCDRMNITAPDGLFVEGAITSNTDLISAGKSFNTHTHDETGSVTLPPN